MYAIMLPTYVEPSGYQLQEVSRPVLEKASEVLIKVHAASINPIDVKKAAGALKFAVKEEFPCRIGYDCAGEVTEVGSRVQTLKVGDQVYTRLPEIYLGSWAEYVKCDEYFVARKPSNMSFAEAAATPLAAMTALQSLRRYAGDLKGKTVFVPAGLSGTGLYACQLAKNVFGAGKVITTVSTSKVEQIPILLGQGVVDQVIDYTKNDPAKIIAPKSVDFIFDTTGQAMQFLPLLQPKTGVVISVSTLPSGSQLQQSGMMRRPHSPKVPILVSLGLNALDSISRLRAWRYGVTYEYLFVEPSAKDLNILRDSIEHERVRAVVGKSASLGNLDQVKQLCEGVKSGKGGIGKMVIQVVEESAR